MNVWLLAATVLAAGLALPGWVIFRRGVGDGLVALEATGAGVVLILLMTAEGFGRDTFFDLALVLAALSIGGGLAFARALERWV